MKLNTNHLTIDNKIHICWKSVDYDISSVISISILEDEIKCINKRLKFLYENDSISLKDFDNSLLIINVVNNFITQWYHEKLRQFCLPEKQNIINNVEYLHTIID